MIVRYRTGTVTSSITSHGDTAAGGGTITVDDGAHILALDPSPGNGLAVINGDWLMFIHGGISSMNAAGVYIEAAATTRKFTVSQSGAITGAMAGILADGKASISNSGVIRGEHGVILNSEGSSLSNGSDGEIIGEGGDGVHFSATGDHIFRNSGLLIGGDGGEGGDFAYESSNDSSRDIIFNSGTIFGSLLLGGGDDKITNAGLIDGIAYLGAGNDTYLSTSGAYDRVLDSPGSDIIGLGGGDDDYVAAGAGGTDGTDSVAGGTGIDTYDASDATSELIINLDGISHNDFSLVNAETAQGTDVTPDGTSEVVFGFENVIGGSGNDIIYGSRAANHLEGGAGDDKLAGYSGNDVIDGGDGGDMIYGGSGLDTLTGGVADGKSDIFFFKHVKESGVSARSRDIITDFDDEGPDADRIDLSAMDANKANGADTNDAFDFIGTNVSFNGVAGELRAVWEGAEKTVLYADLNGDMKADFSIELTGLFTLDDGDFFL